MVDYSHKCLGGIGSVFDPRSPTFLWERHSVLHVNHTIRAIIREWRNYSQSDYTRSLWNTHYQNYWQHW